MASQSSVAATGSFKFIFQRMAVTRRELDFQFWSSRQHAKVLSPRYHAATVSFPAHGNRQHSPSAAVRPPRRHFALSNIFLPRGEDGRPSRSVVESYTNNGFVVNGTLFPGAVVLLPEAALLWNVSIMDDVNWDSLIALRVLSPKPGKNVSRWLYSGGV